ncbi:MAG: 30S ribosomal protein S9 [Candidatus Zambryskibacteria bacterium RIFCSPHIGHO2_02_FULL_43_14]|uniref:Small ribosomal subunit protein uS9 n=1 Tax=Candidatus Zambryskibacteria bacterium RIFCSPHIGHO2_02_FULL_43_14 TaxID=1802748 RepID=A0A1G2TFQ0_9BACT|nr:MAG: 30S ribosomal protein S9 [Candidatus Zambryskibacteria bacterium RIFCSPHIGHO2_01_FULL_43_60]OHA96107.1 MAG: 30S ribosomal protein S9 [Candidatus Zambryskibacteria bacterium RIFCSPHIGHO2_02_FULL_43_14]OHB03494.1 MAG: 30S ribosomal protein S9 [Candidatus Zambryskibacteria bacterium RIFCSPLOWO2_01_FULL_42_41]
MIKDKPVRQIHTGGYIEAIGRRKTSVARVRITPASKISISINDEEFEKYFPTMMLRKTVLSVFDDVEGKFTVTAKLSGGGISSQAEALRHGLARALVSHEPSLRTKLKVKGFLKRDPRAKERRKFGLKKARKAPQWSKR